MPQIEVTFDIDANSILNVSARDKATGKQQNITITASSTLTKDEIERMVKEAEANAAEDTKRKQEIEVRNQTDSLVYSTERTLVRARQQAGRGRPQGHRRRAGGDEGSAQGRGSRAHEAGPGDPHQGGRTSWPRSCTARRSRRQRRAGCDRPDQRPPGPKEGEVVDAEFEDLGEKK